MAQMTVYTIVWTLFAHVAAHLWFSGVHPVDGEGQSREAVALRCYS